MRQTFGMAQPGNCEGHVIDVMSDGSFEYAVSCDERQWVDLTIDGSAEHVAVSDGVGEIVTSPSVSMQIGAPEVVCPGKDFCCSRARRKMSDDTCSTTSGGSSDVESDSQSEDGEPFLIVDASLSSSFSSSCPCMSDTDLALLADRTDDSEEASDCECASFLCGVVIIDRTFDVLDFGEFRDFG